MSRRISRPLAALTAAVAVTAGTLAGAPLAVAATTATPVSNLVGTPVATSKVMLTWDAYTADFTPDHYVATLQPGNREIPVAADTTEATFGDLTWGTTYTASVIACDDAGCTNSTPAATLVLPGARLNANISTATADRGDRVTISGTLKWTESGKPIRNADIEVQAAYAPFPPYSYKPVTTVSTDRTGAFSVRVRANRTAVYRVFFGRVNTAGSFDGAMDLAVRAPMSLRFSDNPVAFGQQVAFSGAFDAPDKLVAGAVVRLQQKVNGRWKSVKSTTATLKGTYRIRYTPTSATDTRWRVWSEAGPSFATSASAAKVLTVR